MPGRRPDRARLVVPQLRGGAVTCTKSEADTVVTEFGAARLYGVPLAERAEALIAIAHPDFRDSLREEARALERRA
jgi:acyl-CoA hydrolase